MTLVNRDSREVTNRVATEWRKGPLRNFGALISYNYSDHYDGRVFRRRRSVQVDLQTRSDHSFSLGWNGGRFEEFDDSVSSLNWQARASDPFHTFGIGYSWGRQADAAFAYITSSVTWRFGDKLTVGVASAILRHIQDAEQQIFTFNHDFSPRQGISGRVVAQTVGTNGYLAYRRSGYGGVETWLILGDPNAAKFRARLVGKVIWPM